jgi:hypothetical protein
VVALVTLLVGAAPAGAVPTGTFVDDGALRIVARSGDQQVGIAVDVVTDTSEGGGGGTYTAITGRLRLTAGEKCAPPPSTTAPFHSCTGAPRRIVVDGRNARAAVSVTADWMWEDVEATLRAGARGGRLETSVQRATFVGGAGPDRVVFHLDSVSGVPVEDGELAVGTAGGADVVVLKGPGARLSSPDGSTPPLVRLGAGDDRYRLRIFNGPAPVRLSGGAGGDDLQAGSDDVVLGGTGDDRLDNGRLIVGGPGRDVITAGWQTLRIRAADGEADSVACLSRRTVVHADPVDRVSECRVVLHA